MRGSLWKWGGVAVGMSLAFPTVAKGASAEELSAGQPTDGQQWVRAGICHDTPGRRGAVACDDVAADGVAWGLPQGDQLGKVAPEWKGADVRVSLATYPR